MGNLLDEEPKHCQENVEPLIMLRVCDDISTYMRSKNNKKVVSVKNRDLKALRKIGKVQ